MKKTVWQRFFRIKKRKGKAKPKSNTVVKASQKKYKAAPELWEPPFSAKKPPMFVSTKDLTIHKEVKGFDLGEITATIGIMLQSEIDHNFNLFVNDCLQHFENLDWGNVTENEETMNNRNILTRTGIVYGSYKDLYSGVQIRIISDLKRGITKVCLSDER